MIELEHISLILIGIIIGELLSAIFGGIKNPLTDIVRKWIGDVK